MAEENLLPELIHTLEKIKPVRPILIEKFRPEMLYYNEIIDDTLETLTNLPRSMQKMRQYRKICSHMLELLRFKKQNGFYREMTTSIALQELEESLSLLINEMNVVSHIENTFGISFEKNYDDDNELRDIMDQAANEVKRLRKAYLERHYKLKAEAADNTSINFEETIASLINLNVSDVNEENQNHGLERILEKIQPVAPALLQKFPSLTRYNECLIMLRNESKDLLDNPRNGRRRELFLKRLRLSAIILNKVKRCLKNSGHEHADTVDEEFEEFEKSHILLVQELNKLINDIS